MRSTEDVLDRVERREATERAGRRLLETSRGSKAIDPDTDNSGDYTGRGAGGDGESMNSGGRDEREGKRKERGLAR